MFIGCNCHKCLSMLTEENQTLLKDWHLISCFHLTKDLIKKVRLWNWLIKCSVGYSFLNSYPLMMKSWYARYFERIFHNHLINLYLGSEAIQTMKSSGFYTLRQGIMLTQVSTQVFSDFFFYHKILSCFLNSLSILKLLIICDACNFSMIFCNLIWQLNLIEATFNKVLYSESKQYLNLLTDWNCWLCCYFTLSFFYFIFIKLINKYLLF